MLVIMKALLSGYNIGLSTIHEARNAKVLCLFAKAAYLDLFILGGGNLIINSIYVQLIQGGGVQDAYPSTFYPGASFL